MHRDARITIYGGTGIGAALVVLGVFTNEFYTLSITGLGLMGAAVAVGFTFDHLQHAD